MALTSRVTVALSGVLTGTSDFGAPQSSPSFARQLDLGSGTGAGLADRIWADQRTLTASSTEDLDLTGTLVDALGATLTLARIKAVYIAAAAGNTNNVVVGAASSNAWAALLNSTGTLTLRPGAFVLLAAGAADATCYAVTGGTGDLLKVANSAGSTSVTYDICVIGASA